MSNSTLRIDFQYGGSVREIYPDPYNQTYDSHLIHSKNPKTVQKFALEGLREFVKTVPDYSSLPFSAVCGFVNGYVSSATKGRWTRVLWNSKSYPD